MQVPADECAGEADCAEEDGDRAEDAAGEDEAARGRAQQDEAETGKETGNKKRLLRKQTVSQKPFTHSHTHTPECSRDDACVQVVLLGWSVLVG